MTRPGDDEAGLDRVWDSLGDLAWKVLDSLDIGVLALREQERRIALANARARRLLMLRSLPAPVPRWLEVPLAYALETDAGASFGPAVKLIRPSGEVLYVRAARLAGAERVVVVTASVERLRKSDAIQILCGRRALNRRQAEVALLIRDGKKNQEIADELHVGLSTVKWYVGSLYTAFSVKNRVELVAVIQRLLSSHP